jgi:predicted cobalt transporter CbtA
MKLFKVFPRFGAMVLGQPVEQPTYSLATHVVGWLYHFSNGATFGVMYLALIGDARRRHWSWAVLFALGLELGMLVTPYPKVFNIPLTARFVIVTVAAHAIFGAGLGLSVGWLSHRFSPSVRTA